MMMIIMIVMIKGQRRGLAQAGKATGCCFSLEIEEHPLVLE